jgi:hypothetical protein
MATTTTIITGKIGDGLVSTLNAVTDEHVTSAFNTWVNTANTNMSGQKPVKLGTVTVKTTNNATTYTQGSDYQFDYINNRIMVLSTGTMLDATAYHVSYTWSDGSLAVKVNAYTNAAQVGGKSYVVKIAKLSSHKGVAVIVTQN